MLTGVGGHRPWRDAWQAALYGTDTADSSGAAVGFYRRELPAGHFRTASHAAAPVVAGAIAELMRRHGLTRLVDVGCGNGELLTALHEAQRKRPDPAAELLGVELRPRPPRLPTDIAWHDALPTLDATPTLLLGWELLDVVPATVAVAGVDGDWFAVDVDPYGAESVGLPLDGAELAWCRRWAEAAPPGTKLEVGSSRESFWHSMVRRLPNGLAVAVDYGIESPAATLIGFRQGRAVPPVPDGSCDLTAHLHWPGLVARLSELGETRLAAQADVLRGLGVAPQRPAAASAVHDGVGYLAALQRFSAESELVDRSGLGDFGWLTTRRLAGPDHRGGAGE